MLDDLFSAATFKRILILPPACQMGTKSASRDTRQIAALKECSEDEWHAKVTGSAFTVERLDNQLLARVNQDCGWGLEGKIGYVLPEKNYQLIPPDMSFAAFVSSGWTRWLIDALIYEALAYGAILDGTTHQLIYML